MTFLCFALLLNRLLWDRTRNIRINDSASRRTTTTEEPFYHTTSVSAVGFIWRIDATQLLGASGAA